jgi:hypothetical protein
MGRAARYFSAPGGVRFFNALSLRYLSASSPHPDAAFGVVGPPHKGEVWSKWRLRAALSLRAVMTK